MRLASRIKGIRTPYCLEAALDSSLRIGNLSPKFLGECLVGVAAVYADADDLRAPSDGSQPAAAINTGRASPAGRAKGKGQANRKGIQAELTLPFVGHAHSRQSVTQSVA